jgi:type IV secretion system protein VirB9
MLKEVIAIILLFLSGLVFADEPITTDNRVKTYVYNENEVYTLMIFYGYQTSIEFAKGEEVTNISMGDSYAWKVNTLGSRLFVKPLEENMHTNMTVITNKRAYQFDLFSKKIDSKYSKDLVYVMRFYYPENNKISDIEE